MLMLEHKRVAYQRERIANHVPHGTPVDVTN
jgi:hypothetical protein